MLDFTTSPTRWSLLIRPLTDLLGCGDGCGDAVTAHRADWRCHKFPAATQVLLSVVAQLDQTQSGRALIEELNDLDCQTHARNLRQMVAFDGTDYWGQPLTLNQSSWSRANTERSWRLWRYLFHRLLNLARSKIPTAQLEGLSGIGKLVAVDGSLFDCLPQMVWALYSNDANKVKAHFFYEIVSGLPTKLVLTTGKGSERAVLEEHFLAHTTYIIDRGYLDFDLFGQMLKQKADFVTRAKDNLNYKVLEDLAVLPEQTLLGIESDQIIELNGANAPKLKLRLVTYRFGPKKTYRYLSSRFELDALSIVRLYLYRWDIELFFGWIKKHLQFSHWYSQCENGVLIQLYAGLITFVLLKLFSGLGQSPKFSGLRLECLRWLKRHLFEPIGSVEAQTYLTRLFDPDAPT